jgi:hypothetical protein
MRFLEIRQGAVCSMVVILSLGASRETRPGDATDASGPTPKEKLGTLGQAPLACLETILFADRETKGRCRDSGVIAESGTRPTAPEPRIRIQRKALAEHVRQAAAGAARRLGDSQCQGVFADFNDSDGVPLQQKLEALGQTAPDWLGLLYFRDGYGLARCCSSRVMAVTQPGSRVIWVCPALLEQHLREPGLAEVMIIHEALHTLGLGENPPTSLEINVRVFARCGR